MKIGIQLGYWGRTPPPDLAQTLASVDDLGLDSVWVAESWGNDAFTYAAWVAAHTKRVRIGTGIVQMAARTPTATAMAAITVDHLSGGRFILGLGASGPQVVEGWYGQPSRRPLARTREYVEIIRRVLRREEKLTFDGEFYQIPYTGPGQRDARQAAELDGASAARRPADLPRRRRPEERHADRGDRRRLAAAVLLAVPARGLRRAAGRRQARLRDPRAGEHQRHR